MRIKQNNYHRRTTSKPWNPLTKPQSKTKVNNRVRRTRERSSRVRFYTRKQVNEAPRWEHEGPPPSRVRISKFTLMIFDSWISLNSWPFRKNRLTISLLVLVESRHYLIILELTMSSQVMLKHMPIKDNKEGGGNKLSLLQLFR